MKNLRKEGQAKKNGRRINRDQSSLKQEHNTSRSPLTQAPLAAVLAAAKVADAMGLATIRSVHLSSAAAGILGIPESRFSPRSLAITLAPLALRPSEVNIGPNQRLRGYFVCDLLQVLEGGVQ